MWFKKHWGLLDPQRKSSGNTISEGTEKAFHGTGY